MMKNLKLNILLIILFPLLLSCEKVKEIKNEPYDKVVTSIALNDSIVWVGTKNGISKFENLSWTNFTESDGLFNNDIRCLDCDEMNNIWIGTRNNRVVKYDGNNFTDYHVNPIESGTGELGQIHTTTNDLEGNIWVGSQSGLTIIRNE